MDFGATASISTGKKGQALGWGSTTQPSKQETTEKEGVDVGRREQRAKSRGDAEWGAERAPWTTPRASRKAGGRGGPATAGRFNCSSPQTCSAPSLSDLHFNMRAAVSGMPLEGVRMINHLKSKILITGCNFCYLRSPLVSRKEKKYIYIAGYSPFEANWGWGGGREEDRWGRGVQHPGWRGRPCWGEGVGVRGRRGGGGVACSPSDIFEGCWLRAFAALNHALARSSRASARRSSSSPGARGGCGPRHRCR